MLDEYGLRVAEVMTTVADAPSGGVLVHCMGGQDRTGLSLCSPAGPRRRKPRDDRSRLRRDPGQPPGA